MRGSEERSRSEKKIKSDLEFDRVFEGVQVKGDVANERQSLQKPGRSRQKGQTHFDNRIQKRRIALMKKTEKAVLIEGLRKLSVDAAWIADALEGKTAEKPAETEVPAETVPEQAEEVPAEEEKTYSFEDVRALLADKARAGFKGEVKAILTAHGVNKLSEITDPAELAKVVQEAEGIGNG